MKRWIKIVLLFFFIPLFLVEPVEATSSQSEVTELLKHLKEEDSRFDQLWPNGYEVFFTIDRENDEVNTVRMMMVPRRYDRDHEESEASFEFLKEEYLRDENLSQDSFYEYVSQQLPDGITLEVYLAFAYPSQDQGQLESWRTTGSPLKVYVGGEKVSDSYSDYLEELYPEEFFVQEYNEEARKREDLPYLSYLGLGNDNAFSLSIQPKDLSDGEIEILQNEQDLQSVRHYLGFEREFMYEGYEELARQILEKFGSGVDLFINIVPDFNEGSSFHLYTYTNGELIHSQIPSYREKYVAQLVADDVYGHYDGSWNVLVDYQDNTYHVSLKHDSYPAVNEETFKAVLDLGLDKDQKFYKKMLEELAKEYKMVSDDPSMIVYFKSENEDPKQLLAINKSDVDLSMIGELNNRAKLLNQIEDQRVTWLDKGMELVLNNDGDLFNLEFEPDLSLSIQEGNDGSSYAYNLFSQYDYMYNTYQEYEKTVLSALKKIEKKVKKPISTVEVNYNNDLLPLLYYDKEGQEWVRAPLLEEANRLNTDSHYRIDSFINYMNEYNGSAGATEFYEQLIKYGIVFSYSYLGGTEISVVTTVKGDPVELTNGFIGGVADNIDEYLGFDLTNFFVEIYEEKQLNQLENNFDNHIRRSFQLVQGTLGNDFRLIFTQTN